MHLLSPDKLYHFCPQEDVLTISNDPVADEIFVGKSSHILEQEGSTKTVTSNAELKRFDAHPYAMPGGREDVDT